MEKQDISSLITANLNEALESEDQKTRTNDLDVEYSKAKKEAIKSAHEEALLFLGKSKTAGEFLVAFMPEAEQKLTTLKKTRNAGFQEKDKAADRGTLNGQITSWDAIRKICISLSSQMAREALVKSTKG